MAGQEQHQLVFGMKGTGKVLHTIDLRGRRNARQICLVEREMGCGLHIPVLMIRGLEGLKMATLEHVGDAIEIPPAVMKKVRPHPKLRFKGVELLKHGQETTIGTDETDDGRMELAVRTQEEIEGGRRWAEFSLYRRDEELVERVNVFAAVKGRDERHNQLIDADYSTIPPGQQSAIRLSFDRGGLRLLHDRYYVYGAEDALVELERMRQRRDYGKDFKPNAAALRAEAERWVQRMQTNATDAQGKRMVWDFDLAGTVGAILNALEHGVINTCRIFGDEKAQGLVRFREVEA